MPTIIFQTAFPFIGLADQTWSVLTQALKADETIGSENLYCPPGSYRMSYCYWIGQQCNTLDLSNYWLNVTFEYYKFSIPFSNLIQQSTNSDGRSDCDLFIVQNYATTDNVLELGDPFFSAFLPVFDVDRELMGLAIASRGTEGSSITFAPPVDPEDPDDPDDPTDPTTLKIIQD